MKKSMKFFWVVFVTVILVRLVMFFVPANNMAYADYYHHAYFGILFLFVLILYNYQFHHKLFYLFAVAIGLIVDEVIYLLPILIDDISKAGYYSWYSWILTGLGLGIVYVLRDLLVKEVEITQTVDKKRKKKRKKRKISKKH
ncbi:hypothetical protein HOD38_03950 [archaeon]|mgnify:CR=1 FL=1|nr:hypothetical protein [archaeon]